MDLKALAEKSTRYGIGLMSGSSCDGIDAGLVRLKGSGAEVQVKLIDFVTNPFTPAYRNRLLAPKMDAREICALNFDIGDRFAEASLDLMQRAEDQDIEVDFIATHGHTIAHRPPGKGEAIGTLQIGEPAIIAERTNTLVISDFRQRDMAAGGQGAPLVPYADWQLFHRPDRTVVCLNLGGIANVTVVTPNVEEVIAFDTGPGNMVIDGAVRQLSRGVLQMDKNGESAGKGVVIDEFLEYLLDHPYFGKVPPKSTGREEFGMEAYLRDALLSRRDHSFDDLVATVTAAVAYSITRAISRFVTNRYEIARVIASGGGTFNLTLMKRIEQGLSGIVVRTSEQYGIPNGAREATAFAMLGNQTICGLPGNIPLATGARHPVILGRITPP